MRRLIFFLMSGALIFLGQPVFAQSAGEFGGRITSFDASYTLSADGTLRVSEKIAVLFDEQRHGIFRYIPVVYKKTFPNPDIDLRTDIISVQDATGLSVPYVESREGDNIQLRIGDAETYVSGSQVYVIEYSLMNTIRTYETSQELYIDVNGIGWNTEIDQVTARVKLDPSLVGSLKEYRCITGLFGNDSSDCEISESDGNVTAVTTDMLSPSENMSYALAFKSGTFPELSFFEKYKDVMLRNILLLSPLVVLPLVYRRWSSNGKDPTKKTVVTQFDAPPDLTSAEVGVLADYSADNKDISSSIIDLAIRGFIKIEDTTKKDTAKNRDFTFHLLKQKSEWSKLQEFEQKILQGVFKNGAIGDTVPLSTLKNSYFSTLAEVKKELYEELTKRGYFDANPANTRAIYISIAVVLGLVVPLLLLIISEGRMLGSALGLFISGIIVAIFARIMPRRTQKGFEAWMYAEGLKQYLSVAEKDRLAMLQSPGSKYALTSNGATMTVELFERLLPFAIVMGVERQWSEKFKDIYTTAPDWYSSSSSGFNTLLFTNSLTNGVNTMSTVMSSQPSSSSSSGFSGGGSGGGFGGGGGGSW